MILIWRDLMGRFKSYAQSKLANILFTKELARKLKGMTNIALFIRITLNHTYLISI